MIYHRELVAPHFARNITEAYYIEVYVAHLHNARGTLDLDAAITIAERGFFRCVHIMRA
jgi:hypothetical protein